ncbi:hypothetical protein CBM2599_B50412 [Cupriavidus taiwanensis]|nr:hypothetical protein CBM2599_B50412 [Cupriavidus taiwanensis]
MLGIDDEHVPSPCFRQRIMNHQIVAGPDVEGQCGTDQPHRRVQGCNGRIHSAALALSLVNGCGAQANESRELFCG